MELQGQLRAHRARLGMSQEELARRVYVSRQTISNWETDRTYPDVQSLLLLSEVFGTSIDELVKGDMEVMEKAVENDWKKMERLVLMGWGLIILGIGLLVAGLAIPSGPSSLLANFTEAEVLGDALFLVLWIAGVALLVRVEALKRKNNLVTYRDLVAYSKGEEPPRDGHAFGRRYPVVMAWVKFLISAALGLLAGVAVGALFLG